MRYEGSLEKIRPAQPAWRAAGDNAQASSLETAPLPLWRELFAGLDWLALRFSPVYRGVGVPEGNGSPVIIVPGLFGCDAYLYELYSWLWRIGYRPYFSNIGLNAECPEVLRDRLVETVERAFNETGQRVRLVGHSLGGLLARAAAMRRPQQVAQVITLGSPLRGVRAHPAVLAAAQLICGRCSGRCVSVLQRPLPKSVAEASIFSKGDRVVDWRTCLQGDGATNVEVTGTHLGLVFNPQVYQALAELLAALPQVNRSGCRLSLRPGHRSHRRWGQPALAFAANA